MELRHLRYFVAVAEAKSLSLAAEQRLHTTQPSLSRQIRDLEEEVGTPLLTRSVRGIDLTPAGQAFLDHARLILAQVEAAVENARRLAHPVRPVFVLGFLTGHEVTWMPEALQILRDELPNIDVMVSSQTSPQLANGLRQGRVDAAILRREEGVPDLIFHPLLREPLMAFMPSDHALAAHEVFEPQSLIGESFLNVSTTAPVLRNIIDSYLQRCGIEIAPAYEADNLAAAMSLIASTRSLAILPEYANNFRPRSVTSRPLKGEAPAIDLVVGYNRNSTSPVLKLFLSRVDELISRVAEKTG